MRPDRLQQRSFFAPQGRDVSRLGPSVPDLDQLFSEFDPHVEGQKVNILMSSYTLVLRNRTKYY